MTHYIEYGRERREKQLTLEDYQISLTELTGKLNTLQES